MRAGSTARTRCLNGHKARPDRYQYLTRSAWMAPPPTARATAGSLHVRGKFPLAATYCMQCPAPRSRSRALPRSSPCTCGLGAQLRLSGDAPKGTAASIQSWRRLTLERIASTVARRGALLAEQGRVPSLWTRRPMRRHLGRRSGAPHQRRFPGIALEYPKRSTTGSHIGAPTRRVTFARQRDGRPLSNSASRSELECLYNAAALSPLESRVQNNSFITCCRTWRCFTTQPQIFVRCQGTSPA